MPGLARRAPGARLARLSGLTNRVYRVELDERVFCLRVPGNGTSAIIDRAKEAANARAAAAIGVAPEVLHFGDDGLMLTPFIAGAATLSAAGFRSDPGALGRVAQALACLHADAPAFVSEFRAFDIARGYFDLLGRRGATPPALAATVLGECATVQQALDARPATLRPCHCDPTGANLLDTGERIWLIDWEYSGMNDPLWDLAYLSIQSAFDAGMDAALLASYFRAPPPPMQSGRMALQQAMVELLSSMWALVQASLGNPVADFRAYADRTLAACQSRMRSRAFRAHLQAVRSG